MFHRKRILRKVINFSIYYCLLLGFSVSPKAILKLRFILLRNIVEIRFLIFPFFFSFNTQNQTRQLCTFFNTRFVRRCHRNETRKPNAQRQKPRKTDWWKETDINNHSAAPTSPTDANDADANYFTEAAITTNPFATTNDAIDESTVF